MLKLIMPQLFQIFKYKFKNNPIFKLTARNGLLIHPWYHLAHGHFTFYTIYE